MGCIGCGLCVDACDSVMEKIGRPTGLIRFDSEANAGAWSKPTPKPFASKPLLFLTVGLLALAGSLWGALSLSPLRVDLEPQRTPLFVRLSDGSIRNDYLLHVQVRAVGLSHLRVRLADGEGGQLRLADREQATITLTGREGQERLLLTRPAGARAQGIQPVHLVVEDARGGRVLTTLETQFWGPPP